MHGSTQSKAKRARESDHGTDECLKPHGELKWEQRCAGKVLDLASLVGKDTESPKAKMSKGSRLKPGKHTVVPYPLLLGPLADLNLYQVELRCRNIHHCGKCES